MATRIAWLLNFDADMELRRPHTYVASARTRRHASVLRHRLTDLLGPEDIVLDMDDNAVPLVPLTVQAFCPTPSALARIASLGLLPPAAPTLAVLRQANDRAFCATLGHELPGSAFARDMQALTASLRIPSPTSIHVIKRAFSFAGREQRRVRDGHLDPSTLGFCARSFDAGEGVQVEPWVTRLVDCSLHGYLTRGGQLLHGTAREQHCDAMGRFDRVLTTPADLLPHESLALHEQFLRTAQALSALGYFGPFGIDGFRYRIQGDEVGFNARCDVNARLTMGYPRTLLQAGLLAEMREPTPDEGPRP